MILGKSLNSVQNCQSQHVIRQNEIADEIMFSTLVSNVLNFCVFVYVYFSIHSWVKLSFSSARCWQVPK